MARLSSVLVIERSLALEASDGGTVPCVNDITLGPNLAKLLRQAKSPSVNASFAGHPTDHDSRIAVRAGRGHHSSVTTGGKPAAVGWLGGVAPDPAGDGADAVVIAAGSCGADAGRARGSGG